MPDQELAQLPPRTLQDYKISADQSWLSGAVIISVILLIAIIWNGWSDTRDPEEIFVILAFVPDTAKVTVDTLTAISLIAVLMERAVGVYVTSQRSFTRNIAKEEIKELERTEEAALDDKKQALQKMVKQAKVELSLYRQGTKVCAYSFSVLFGTLIAIAGVRAVTPMLDVPFDELNNFQWAALQVLDIAFTAALIAGGSNGIHRIISDIGDRTSASETDPLDAETRPG